MNDKTIRYTGDVLNCKKHGTGVYKYPGADFYSYEGAWENGEKHGGNGKFVIAGYSNYEGDFKHGEISGIGKRVWQDGRIYIGEWLNGEMHGKGTWISADSQETYEGEFKDNKRDGRGQLKLRNGDTYNGSFSLHKFEGEGVYLRENSFFISAEFEKGCLNGQCSVKWHKLASFDGRAEEDIFSGHGHFLVLDGSFEHEGSFVGGRPEISPASIEVTLNRSACKVETDSKKDKKKKPAAKKGAVEVEPVGVVPAGQDLGQLVVTLQYSTSISDPSSAKEESTDSGMTPLPIAIANGEELRRKMRVRLRPYIPPAPPAKGAAPEPPNPDAEMGESLPLHLRRLTAEERSTAWERFPLHCLRYVNGVNPLSGEKIILEGTATEFSDHPVTITPARSATGEGADSAAPIIETITATVISFDPDSCVSCRFAPGSLRGASEQLSFLADWRLGDLSEAPRSTCDIGGKMYAELSVLSVSHVMGELEASGRLALVLLSPQLAAEQNGEEKWTDCLWELRMTQDKKMVVSQQQGGDGEVRTNQLQEESDTSPHSPDKLSVLYRWSDAFEFDPNSWHSVALSIGTGGVELAVDGAGRMKSGGPFEEGVAEAWLPDIAVCDAAVAPELVDMIFRVGYGSSFCGYVKNIVVCTR